MDKKAEVNSSYFSDLEPRPPHGYLSENDHHAYLESLEKVFTKMLYARRYCEPDICGIDSRGSTTYTASTSSRNMSPVSSTTRSVVTEESHQPRSQYSSFSVDMPTSSLIQTPPWLLEDLESKGATSTSTSSSRNL